MPQCTSDILKKKNSNYVKSIRSKHIALLRKKRIDQQRDSTEKSSWGFELNIINILFHVVNINTKFAVTKMNHGNFYQARFLLRIFKDIINCTDSKLSK